MNTAHESYTAPPTMWLTTCTTLAPDPHELQQVRQRYPQRVLLSAPMPAVESQLWSIAFEDERFLEEVPVVIEEVKQARRRGLEVVR